MFEKKSLKGMTLVEMLVAIFIFTLGIAGFTMLMSRSYQINATVLEEGSATRSASEAVNSMVSDLRKIQQASDGSYPIQSLGNFSLIVFLDDDNDGIVERVHYYLDGNQNLIKGVAKPVGGIYPANETTKVIVPYVTNTSSQPIFYYFDNLYPIGSSGPMANPYPSDVRLIKIRLWVNIKPNIAPDNVNIESFAELRNINENY